MHFAKVIIREWILTTWQFHWPIFNWIPDIHTTSSNEQLCPCSLTISVLTSNSSGTRQLPKKLALSWDCFSCSAVGELNCLAKKTNLPLKQHNYYLCFLGVYIFLYLLSFFKQTWRRSTPTKKCSNMPLSALTTADHSHRSPRSDSSSQQQGSSVFTCLAGRNVELKVKSNMGSTYFTCS